MIIDANTSLGRWPFQSFDIDSAQALGKHLRAVGIGKALVSSMDAVLYPDPAVCDAALIEALASEPMLMPVQTINPTLTNWRSILEGEDLRTVRVIPNYHGYQLNAREVARFMEAVTERKIPLMIQMRVEDERNQYPLMKVPGVSYKAVISLANAHPRVPIVCLCAYRNEAIQLVQETRNVRVDIPFIETFRTMTTILRQIPPTRILFGSHSPFFYTASAVMKLEAIRSRTKAYNAVAHSNAARLFGLSE